MIFPRVIFTGDVVAGIAWVGAAKKWARECYALHLPHKTYRPTPDVTFHVSNIFPAQAPTKAAREERGICHVTIEAGGGGGVYQFFGSEEVLYKTYQDPLNLDRYLPLGNWVRVTGVVKKGEVELTATPLLSNINESSEGQWPYNPNPYAATRVDGTSPLTIQPVHQPDGLGVKVWRGGPTKARTKPWLATVWTEPAPFYGAYLYSASSPSPFLAHMTDVNYDIAPTVFSNKTGRVQVPETDWYRGGAIQTVSDEQWGARSFIIMVDVAHTFWCYPRGVQGDRIVSEPLDDKANVAAKYVQSQKAPWPGWVTLESVGRASGRSALDQSRSIQPCWVFSPAGDKAAVIVFYRAEPWADEYYTSARLNQYTGLPEYLLQDDYPGVVEVEFTISLTGPNPEDFSFAVTVKQESCSIDDGRGYLAAGYCAVTLDDLPGAPQYNELIIVEHEYYVNVNRLFRPSKDYEHNPSFPVMDLAGRVLKPPHVAAVAKVTAEGRTVMGWLSSYIAYTMWTDQYSASELFTPLFSELADTLENDPWDHQISWQTHINAMDLTTLSFVLGTALNVMGSGDGGQAFTPMPGYFSNVLMHWPQPLIADAAVLSVYIGGVRKEQKSLGHSELQLAIQQAFPEFLPLTEEGYPPLVAGKPDLTEYMKIDLRATIDSKELHPAPDSDLYEDLFRIWYYSSWQYTRGDTWYEGELIPGDHEPLIQQQFATITLNSGSGGFVTEKVLYSMAFASWVANPIMRAGYPVKYYNLFEYSSLFPSRYLIMLPRIFTLFDNTDYYLRPGILWIQQDTELPKYLQPTWKGYPDAMILEPGTTEYTGYPMGALVHARFATAALHALNNGYATLSTHPNGSYAVFVGPFAAHDKPLSMHPNINEPVAKLGSTALTAIQQDVLDVICLRMVHGNEYVEKKTTHLEQINEAFQLNLQPVDYAYQFYLEDGKLKVQLPTYAPDLLTPWDGNHWNENNSQFFSLIYKYGHAVILSPICQGWMKHVLVAANDTLFWDTLPVFSMASLLDSETHSPVAMPTPRMEGVFGPLPIKPEAP